MECLSRPDALNGPIAVDPQPDDLGIRVALPQTRHGFADLVALHFVRGRIPGTIMVGYHSDVL